MSYLIRVSLPDVPGSLGELAEAFGMIAANIQSVDIVDTVAAAGSEGAGMVTDDIVVELPTGTMVDTLITAVASVQGAEVDSIRPFTGRVDRRGQIQMLSRIVSAAGDEQRAMEELVGAIPRSMTSSWAVALRETEDGLVRVAASQAAPEDDGSHPEMANVDKARILLPDADTWVPEAWWLLDTALSITRLPGTDLVLVVGRVGGPDFLASEVAQIGDLGSIIGAILS